LRSARSTAEGCAFAPPQWSQSLSTPHDALFRHTFGQPEHAAPLLSALLPPVLARAIDWGSLSPLPEAAVDAQLRDRRCDLLFLAQLHRRAALLYVLFEHKSQPDRWTALQVLGYAVAAWQERRRRDPRLRRLPPIVPVVVHCGRRPWRASTQLNAVLDLAALPAEVRAAVDAMQPQFTFTVHDFARRSERDLRAMALSLHGLWSLACMQFVATRKDDDAAVAAAFADWADVGRRVIQSASGHDALAAITSYILQTTRLDRARLAVVVGRHLGDRAMKEFVSTADQIRREGFAEALGQLLTRRFGPLPADVTKRLQQAGRAELQRWMARAIDAASLAAVFAD